MIEEISEGVFNRTTSLTLVSLRHNRLDETRMAPLAWINHRYSSPSFISPLRSSIHHPATLLIHPSPCYTPHPSITLLHSSITLLHSSLNPPATLLLFLESGGCVLTEFLSPGAWSRLTCPITTSTWFPPTCQDPSFTWFWLGIT